jgi:hypothetical protein
MQAYPFGIPSVASTAISASTALSASFLSATIATASLALNILGPTGPSGSNVTAVGIAGPTGSQGPAGEKGLGVYLLSSSLSTCLPECVEGFSYQCETPSLSKITYQDGTYTLTGCTQQISYNECDPDTCGLIIPGQCGA